MNQNEKKLAWKPTEKSLLLQTRILDVQSQKAISPEGNESTFIIFDAPDWVITVPFIHREQAKKEFGIDDDCFLMVCQWRHGSECISVEFPGGVIDKGEEPLIAAKREFVEETGYESEEIIHLGSLNPNPAIFSNTLHVYGVKNCINTHKRNLDDDEYVSFQAIPTKEVLANMGKKPYVHALMSTALLLFLQNKELF